MEYPNDGVREAVWIFVTRTKCADRESQHLQSFAAYTWRGHTPCRQACRRRAGRITQAARLAAIMRLVARAAVAAPTARWPIADTSTAQFGQDATDLVTQWRAATLAGLQADRDRARTGQRGLGDELWRWLPTAKTHGYDGLAARRTQSNFGGAAFDSWAEVTHYHPPGRVAATIWNPLRSGSVLGTQTPVSILGARSAIRSPRCDQRDLPGTGHPARGWFGF